MATGTNSGANVPLRTEVERLNDALRRMRRATTVPQTDTVVEGLIRRLGEGRAKPAEHVFVLTEDALQRGAPREDVEAFARALLAYIGRRFGDVPVTTSDTSARFAAETDAECAANPAQLRYERHPTAANLDAAARTTAAHLDALAALHEAYQSALYQFDTNGSTGATSTRAA